MKGKCKKILSLALVLAMVVQLFAGLGNVAKASSSSATEVTITGRHTQNDASANGETPEQIGFAVNGTIKDGNWYNATITSGAVKKNGEEQSGWKVQVTGASTFNLVCWDYTPQVNDTITIPAGTQFTINDTDDVYEITNEYTIIFDKYGWRVAAEYTTDITIKQFAEYSTSQIEFDINEAITIGKLDWITRYYMTYGSILLDDEAQSTWYIYTKEASNFVLVCEDYTPANGDVIKILAGTQFTCEGVGYEIINDFAIQWDGTTWAEYVEPVVPVEGTPITITGRHTQNDASANGDTPEQIGFAVNGTIKDGNWYNATITSGAVKKNGEEQSDWKVLVTGSSTFSLVCWNYTPVVGDIITIPTGTQFTINDTTDAYAITNEYNIVFDEYGWRVAAEYTTNITIKQFAEYSTSPIQIEFDINEAITIGKLDWLTRYYMTYGSILLDDEAQSTWYIYTKEASNFVLVCEDYTPTNGDVIKILAGTQFTCEGTVYEIANDCTVYYMNGVFADSPLYTITKTVDDETTVETVSGTYTLPEISTKKGYITLGWDVDGTLYKVGDVLSAKDEGYTIKPVHVAFSQLDGAQVRISAPEDEKVGGIRFICKLGSDSKSEHILQMGMLIIPTDYMTMGELTHENYGEQTEDYGTSKGYREFVVDNAGMKLEVFAQDEVANGTQAYYLKGSIVNLKDYNYTRNYSARSFLKVQYKDGAEYIYTDYSKDNNSRRICDIAKKMIETYPEQYAPNQNKKYPIVYEYAKVADTMESFAFYGPQAVISNGEYNVDETKQAMQEYANTGFKYLLMDGVGYHVDNTFGTTTLEEEQTVYNSPRVPELDLKQTMQIAKECGLEIIVLDWTLYKLSTSDIPLVETSASEDQVIAMCIKTTDSAYELIGSAIDETQFNKEDGTYTYNGETATVLHYVEQFESDDALKDWVAIKMSAYAKEDNFRGVRLVDEPRKSQYTAIAVLTKVIKELYPNAYIQTGNLPSYSEVYDSDYNTWSNAWSNLLEVNTNATEVGLNYYPYKMNTGITGYLGDSMYELQSNYLRTLQELAITTRDKGLNLELSIQSFAQQNLHHTVNAQRLSLQAHLALAFGTKTLGSFLYTAADNSFTQTIVSDNNLRNAVLYANKNGNYLKAHMTFFKYQGSKVYGSGDYVSASGLTQLETLQKSIITVPSGATVLVNEFYNQYTGQYGYYIVNLATLHNTSTGVDINNGDITINLSTDCLVYKDYQSYQSKEKNKVNSVTLSDGQGAFIVVED